MLFITLASKSNLSIFNMVSTTFLFALLSASTAVLAIPVHQKRIAQVIADSTHDWEQACVSLTVAPSMRGELKLAISS